LGDGDSKSFLILVMGESFEGRERNSGSILEVSAQFWVRLIVNRPVSIGFDSSDGLALFRLHFRLRLAHSMTPAFRLEISHFPQSERGKQIDHIWADSGGFSSLLPVMMQKFDQATLNLDKRHNLACFLVQV
jgi:hypothetical protein